MIYIFCAITIVISVATVYLQYYKVLSSRVPEMVEVNSTLSDITLSVYDVLLPRSKFPHVLEEHTIDDVKEIFKSSGYTSIPIYNPLTDTIVKIIDCKQFIYDSLNEDSALKKPLYLCETKTCEQILLEMFAHDTDIAIIVDEYGGLKGTIYMIDILHYKISYMAPADRLPMNENITRIGDTFVVKGITSLDTVNKYLNLSLYSESSNTINGYITDMLNHFPSVSDTVTIGGYTCTVLTVNNLCADTIEFALNNTQDLHIPVDPEV